MAWAFIQIRTIFDLTKPITIYSVGCGPSTELYGAAVVFRNTPLYYKGFDLNDIWGKIQLFNVQNLSTSNRIISYECCDFIKYVRDNDVRGDILVFNYFFSDFIKYQPNACDSFIDDLIILLAEGRFTVIIINDIMLLYSSGTGYACMEAIANKLKENQQYKYTFNRSHFAAPNEFQFNYGSKHNGKIGFMPVIKEALPFEPFLTCGSIQLIIQTIKKS